MKRWKVQAMLPPYVTGDGRPFRYQPSYHFTRLGARRQRERLIGSFAPGSVVVMMERNRS